MTDNSMQFNGSGVSINPEELAGAARKTTNIEMLMDVSMLVTVELGRTRMTLRQVLDLQNGSVVELDRLAGDPVDIYVNERLIARGEVVVVDDKFGVRINELVGSNGETSEK
jgi:flagellar motor switch protein FliN/FliY